MVKIESFILGSSEFGEESKFGLVKSPNEPAILSLPVEKVFSGLHQALKRNKIILPDNWVVKDLVAFLGLAAYKELLHLVGREVDTEKFLDAEVLIRVSGSGTKTIFTTIICSDFLLDSFPRVDAVFINDQSQTSTSSISFSGFLFANQELMIRIPASQAIRNLALIKNGFPTNEGKEILKNLKDLIKLIN